MTLPAASAAAAATTLELAMAMDPLTLIKVLQLLPMGLGGVAMATDCLHGKVRPRNGRRNPACHPR